MRARASALAVAVFAAAWCSAACSGGTTAPAGTPKPDTPAPNAPAPNTPQPLDASLYPEFTAGSAPLIIIAPHGGAVAPGNIPDRSCSECVTVNDANTQDLARQIADSFQARTGKRPSLVINLLSRRKFDANREIVEATGGYAPLEPVWTALHAAIDSAKKLIGASPGRGLVIDLHGHAHAVQRLELGYLLSATTLRLSDSTLEAQGSVAASSIKRLAADRAGAVASTALLRGPASLGGLIRAGGYAAVPAPDDPAPLVGESYFNGGYNTVRHGSLTGGPTDAIQIECNFDGVRDTSANRGQFAGKLAGALVTYLKDQYGWVP